MRKVGCYASVPTRWKKHVRDRADDDVIAGEFQMTKHCTNVCWLSDAASSPLEGTPGGAEEAETEEQQQQNFFFLFFCLSFFFFYCWLMQKIFFVKYSVGE